MAWRLHFQAGDILGATVAGVAGAWLVLTVKGAPCFRRI